ncbi:hypothetical protein EDB87DRAFT_1577278 [Lactarius vividus]|nr:hypothetical protein EDB87DRAFT_1577278 [Lactarius vividus]
MSSPRNPAIPHFARFLGHRRTSHVSHHSLLHTCAASAPITGASAIGTSRLDGCVRERYRAAEAHVDYALQRGLIIAALQVPEHGAIFDSKPTARLASILGSRSAVTSSSGRSRLQDNFIRIGNYAAPHCKLSDLARSEYAAHNTGNSEQNYGPSYSPFLLFEESSTKPLTATLLLLLYHGGRLNGAYFSSKPWSEDASPRLTLALTDDRVSPEEVPHFSDHFDVWCMRDAPLSPHSRLPRAKRRGLFLALQVYEKG